LPEKLAKSKKLREERPRMRIWFICAVALGLQIPSYAKEDSVRTFQSIDPVQLDKKVPRGFGQIFVEAGRKNNIDPLILAAISAHESGAWKSKAARLKHNWMGLIARGRTKRFETPEASIFYAAELLNRAPFRGHNTLSSIACVYCATNPSNWKREILRWRSKIEPRELRQSREISANNY
jgi:hypothetical protein